MPETIEAPPLELTRWRLRHVPELMAAIERSQADLAEWLPWADPMPTAEAEEAVVREGERAFDADETYGYFLIEVETGELVGGVGLHPRSGDTAEVGYWVRSDRTRRGYAAVAATAVAEVAFERLLHIDRLIIRMDKANHASAAVPPKCGFVLVGEEHGREIAARGHTGSGWIWARHRRPSAPPAERRP